MGMARMKPATAGMDVRRLIVNAVPPSRATRTGRNGVAELTTPIAMESERMIRALWIVSDAEGRPGRRRDSGTEGRGSAAGRLGRGPMVGRCRRYSDPHGSARTLADRCRVGGRACDRP